MVKNNENQESIRPKDLNDLLNEDPTLRRKINYEDMRHIQGVDDTQIEAAYKVYCKMVSREQHHPKKK